MKSTYANYIGVLATCFLAACSKNDNKQDPGSQNQNIVPAKLNFSRPAPGPGLTKDQVLILKKTLKVDQKMILPPGELIFPDKSMSPAELAKRENDLLKKDKNSYDLLQEVRGTCQKGHPTLQFDATFPTDEVSENTLMAGDRLSYSGSAGIGGSNCAVETSAGFGMGAEVKDKNDAEKSITVGSGIGAKAKFAMKNPKFAQLLGARGMIVDSSISGLAIRRDVSSNKQDRFLIKFQVSGSFLSLTQDIPYLEEIEALSEIVNSQQGKPVQEANTEVSAKIKIQIREFTAELVAHTQQVGETVTLKEFYLNGKQMTENELTDLFGNNFPGSNIQNDQTINALK